MFSSFRERNLSSFWKQPAIIIEGWLPMLDLILVSTVMKDYL
ncbi:hypothetical protein [Paenibacillus sp. PvR053]